MPRPPYRGHPDLVTSQQMLKRLVCDAYGADERTVLLGMLEKQDAGQRALLLRRPLVRSWT